MKMDKGAWFVIENGKIKPYYERKAYKKARNKRSSTRYYPRIWEMIRDEARN
jgi:hypothetical protein